MPSELPHLKVGKQKAQRKYRGTIVRPSGSLAPAPPRRHRAIRNDLAVGLTRLGERGTITPGDDTIRIAVAVTAGHLG